MTSIEGPELDAVLDALLSLFPLRDELGLSASELVDTVADALDASGLDELAFADEENRESFKAVLAEFFEVEALEVTAKAIGLVYEQDHIIHGNPRILTDVRPRLIEVFERARTKAENLIQFRSVRGIRTRCDGDSYPEGGVP